MLLESRPQPAKRRYDETRSLYTPSSSPAPSETPAVSPLAQSPRTFLRSSSLRSSSSGYSRAPDEDQNDILPVFPQPTEPVAVNAGPVSSTEPCEAQKRDDAKLRPQEDSFLDNAGVAFQPGRSGVGQPYEVSTFWTTSPDGYAGVEQPSMAAIVHQGIAEFEDNDLHVRAIQLTNAGKFGSAVAGFQYNDMRTATPPLTEENDLPRAPIEVAAPERTVSMRLSAMFLFGQSSLQDVAMSDPHDAEMPASKKRKRSSLFWQSKRESENAVPPFPPTLTATQEDVQTAHSNRWHFDSLRQSVSVISASLKQIAGRKRSRDDDGERSHDNSGTNAVEQTSRERLAGSTTLSNTPLRFPALEVHLSHRLPMPFPPQERPFFFRYPRASLAHDVNTIWSTDYLIKQPVGEEGGEGYEVPWTREERMVFGDFVRAAEEGEMDVDIGARSMGLATRLQSCLDPSHRSSRKQAEQESHDHGPQNGGGLLDIALRRGRMRSFTPDDLPAFYRAQEERRVQQEQQQQQQQGMGQNEGRE